MNATVMCEKCGKPLGVFDGNTCAECSKIDAIRAEIEDLSKRVETLKKQMKEDKEEQLNKLKAELDYAKFRCALPTIMDNMMARDKK